MLLDMVLGGRGWAIGRVANVVGNESSGKTLLAVEACANFMRVVSSPDDIRYIEAEMAYDEAYGRTIGMPKEIHPVDNIGTVEQLFADLHAFCVARKGRRTPSLYVVDSLDALSDDAEMGRDMDEASFGAAKAKRMSEMFRRTIAEIAEANCTLIIISQLRDKLGVMFGEKQGRSGGRALSFYSSQTIWLTELKKVEKTVRGSKHVIGTTVQVRNRKCKVGTPYRRAEVTIWFNYGVDDEGSMLDFLAANKAGTPSELDSIYDELKEARKHQDREWLDAINNLLREMVQAFWLDLEEELAPPLRKYA